jgi:uncharacterized Zn finger protein
MRKWMEKDCPDTPSLPAEVSIDREELRQLRDELAQYKNERDALRAKIEEMEKQEPVGKIVAFGESLHEPSWRGGRLPPLMTELYALPGAKGE